MADFKTRTGNQLVSFYQEPPRRPSNAIGVELLPMERARDFVLPGPVVVGIVYVRHPIDERELIAFADYDEKVAQDRYKEALRVFTMLGAARIVATSRRQTLKHARGWLKVRDVGLDIGAESDARWSLAFDQEGAGGVPLDPRPFRFPDEPMLDAVCDGVLRLGATKGRIQITRSATLGVDGELAVRLKKAGFQLGVSGTKVVVTEFVVEAAFTPEASKDLDKVVAKTELGIAPSHKSRLRRHSS